MGRTELCGAVHTAQRQTSSQIPIGHCSDCIGLGLGVCACVLTLSNSSIRQIPLSASTSAPASSVHSRDTGFLCTYAVKPTADAPCPVVKTTRGPVFSTYLRNCDLAVPGSPHNSTLMSPRTLCLPPETRTR